MHCGVDLDWIRTGFGAESIELQWDLGDHLRKALQMADVGVAEMADYIGSHRSTVSAWIGGQAEPKVGVLRLWAMRTGVDFAWLCAARDSNPEPADLWPVAA